jgi:hypothetical protein
VPFGSENSRWANSGSKANTDESRKTQGANISATSSRGHESNSDMTAAQAFESRVSQAI